MRRGRLTAAAAVLDAGKTSLYVGGPVEREGKWGMTKMELEREGMTWKAKRNHILTSQPPSAVNTRRKTKASPEKRQKRRWMKRNRSNKVLAKMWREESGETEIGELWRWWNRNEWAMEKGRIENVRGREVVRCAHPRMKGRECFVLIILCIMYTYRENYLKALIISQPIWFAKLNI